MLLVIQSRKRHILWRIPNPSKNSYQGSRSEVNCSSLIHELIVPLQVSKAFLFITLIAMVQKISN